MATKLKEEPLNARQRAFCKYYIYDWNGTQAAIKAGYSEHTAAVIAHENLRKPNIQAFIEELQADLEKQAGLSRLKVLEEVQKIAFSSIAHLHNTWITRKEFEELTEEQKSAIAEITTQTRTEMGGPGGETEIQVDYVKVKLYDKIRAVEVINKMLGYNAAEKTESIIKGVKTLIVNPASAKRTGNK